MCEICKWIKEFEATKKPAKITIPLTYSIGYESPSFKLRYCPKCGRRLDKNGGKDNDN